MAYMRWPSKENLEYYDRPFEYEGFSEERAEIAVNERILKLGWRVREMNTEMLPTEIDKSLIVLL